MMTIKTYGVPEELKEVASVTSEKTAETVKKANERLRKKMKQISHMEKEAFQRAIGNFHN